VTLFKVIAFKNLDLIIFELFGLLTLLVYLKTTFTLDLMTYLFDTMAYKVSSRRKPGSSVFASALSMPEVPHPSKRHHHPLLIRCINHFLIAHRATRLHDRRRTGIDHNIQPIAKREKSIGSHCRTGEREIGVLRLDRGNAR
jgi:hypothetical protein